MGNSNKNESSYESNTDNLNLILSEDYNSIMKDTTYNEEDFQDTYTYDNMSCFQDNLEFTKLYKFRCQGKIKEPEVLKSITTTVIMYAEDKEPNYEKDIDINYSYPDSHMQFVLEL